MATQIQTREAREPLSTTRRRTAWLRYLVLAITLFLIIFPFYWMVVTSFKFPVEIAAIPPTLWPHHFTLSNYVQDFIHYTFGRYVINSLIVALSTTILILFLGSLAGYSLARLPIRGKVPILLAILVISLFPEIAVVPPLYLILRSLGWLNSYQALIIPYTAFNLPFGIWIMNNYFLGIPKEMEESARIDGAGTGTILFRIVLPLALPGMFTAGIFSFTAAWTEFLMALSFNSVNHMRTIPVGIALFGSQFTVPYGNIFAASVVAVVPIAVLVLIFQRWVVSGLTAGAVKG
jgi:multiple sugar transport system permease protein